MLFPDSAMISATIPAKTFCVGLNRNSVHEKLSQLLSGVSTELFLSGITSCHARSALREFAHEILRVFVSTLK